MGKLGTTSRARLNTCHSDLIEITELAIKRSRIDFGISEGMRSIERQKELFTQGKTKIDGVNEKGKHNYSPSLALDFYAYHPDDEIRSKIAYDKPTLAYIAAIFICCAQELFEAGEITHLVRWGGNWDKDGVILLDQSFDDMPHIELFKP